MWWTGAVARRHMLVKVERLIWTVMGSRIATAAPEAAVLPVKVTSAMLRFIMPMKTPPPLPTPSIR